MFADAAAVVPVVDVAGGDFDACVFSEPGCAVAWWHGVGKLLGEFVAHGVEFVWGWCVVFGTPDECACVSYPDACHVECVAGCFAFHCVGVCTVWEHAEPCADLVGVEADWGSGSCNACSVAPFVSRGLDDFGCLDGRVEIGDEERHVLQQGVELDDAVGAQVEAGVAGAVGGGADQGFSLCRSG